MLGISTLDDGRLAHFEFGTTLDPALDDEQRIRRAVDQYDRLADEAWDVPPHLSPPILLALLEEHRDDPPRLAAVVSLLGEMFVENAAGPIEPLIEHPNESVRLAAVTALGRIGQFSSIRLLGPLLQSPVASLRRAATIAMGKFGVPATAVAALGYGASDDELKNLAMEGLARSQAVLTAAPAPLVHALLDTGEWLDLRALVGLVAPELFEALRSPRVSDRARARAAAVLLFHRRRLAALDALRLAPLEEHDASTRVTLATAFGRCRTRAAVPWLTTLLTHADVRTHEAAVLALGRIGDPASFAPLLARWNDREGALRPLITVALRRLCAVEGIHVLWDIIRLDQPPPTGAMVLLTDTGEAYAGAPPALVAPQLALRNYESRRDATVLLGALAGAAGHGALLSLRQREPEAELRTILEASVQRVVQRPDPAALAPLPEEVRAVLTPAPTT